MNRGKPRTDSLTEQHRQKRRDRAGDPDCDVEDERVMLSGAPPGFTCSAICAAYSGGGTG